jgi:hypothetical protein
MNRKIPIDLPVINDGDQECYKCDKCQRREVQPPENYEDESQNTANNTREKGLLPLQNAVEDEQKFTECFEIMLRFVENLFLKITKVFNLLIFFFFCL